MIRNSQENRYKPSSSQLDIFSLITRYDALKCLSLKENEMFIILLVFWFCHQLTSLTEVDIHQHNETILLARVFLSLPSDRKRERERERERESEREK